MRNLQTILRSVGLLLSGRIFNLVGALLLVTVFGLPIAALAQGTGFTYQGRLNDSANPANGFYDLRFAIYDADTSGVQQGPTLTYPSIAVSNGLFTVTLDFGNQFPGANRWLELSVRTNGGGAFSTLAPRQPLRATPYAVFAGGASAAGVTGTLPANVLSGVNGGGLINLNATNVAGTVADARLSAHVALLNRDPQSFAGLNSFASTVTVGIRPLTDEQLVNLRVVGNNGPSWKGGGAFGHNNAAVILGELNGAATLGAHTPNLGAWTNLVINPVVGANVGIGKTNPATALDVAGIVTASSFSGTSAGANAFASTVKVGTRALADGQTMNLRVVGNNSPSWKGGGAFGHSNAAVVLGELNGMATLGAHTPNLGAWTNLIINPVVGANVGIGKADPATALDVNGTVTATSFRGAFTGDGSGLTNLNVTELASPITSAQLDPTISNGLWTASGTNVFRSGGFVGIGTTTPDTRLDVAGDITCVAVNLTSDRNAKEQFKPVSTREVLAKVARLPITEWQYKTGGDARHIGPMAQDFRAAFALGHDDRHITSVDADGVALAAIQGLNEKLEEQVRDKDERIQELERAVAELRSLVKNLAPAREGVAK